MMIARIYQGRPYLNKADWTKKMIDSGASATDIEKVNALQPSVNE